MNNAGFTAEQLAQFAAWQTSQGQAGGLTASPANRIAELRAQMLAQQVSGKGQFFPVNGRFRVLSKLVKYQRSNQMGTLKESIVAEFTVQASSLAEVEVGGTRSELFMFKHQGWLARFKALVLAMAGFDPNGALSPEVNMRAADIYVALMEDGERQRLGLTANFLEGIPLDLETLPHTTRNSVQVVHHSWMPVRAGA